MTEPAAHAPPIALGRVERMRGEGDVVRLRLSGRRMRERSAADEEALLVISLQGRRHRFPAVSAGVYGWAPDDVASVAVTAVRAWDEAHPGELDEVRCVLFSAPVLEAFERAMATARRR